MGIVVTYAAPGSTDEHERATHSAVAKTLAELKGFEFGGEYDPARRYGAALYFVPSATLLVDAAQALGIRGKDDLFGGVVPASFVATKAIVHPLVAPDAQAPAGWSAAFAEEVRPAVLPGFCAFSLRDARRAGLELLREGRIRLKPAQGVGGHGQRVVKDEAELESALGSLDRAELERCGLGVELDLEEAITYSVGQVWAAGLLATYCGTQRSTRNNRGAAVFGGSDLIVVRGGYDELTALPLSAEMRIAIGQARAFDSAAGRFAGMFASRRNYDAVRGRDSRGRQHAGVLEQSWRIGGASTAEVAALAAFAVQPRLRAVRACCTEAYGRGSPPPGASVHFDGVDRRIGPLTKYAVVEKHEISR